MNFTSSIRTRRGMWWVALVLALAGLALAIELTRIHLRLQADPTHRSFCNLRASVNCDDVAKSSYAMLLGLPLSVWGIFGYVASLVTSVWGLRSRSLAPVCVLWVLGAICVLGALALAAISAFVLRTLCLLCLASWVIDIGLFVAAVVLAKGHRPNVVLLELVEWLRENLRNVAALAVVGAVALGLTYRAYLHPGEALSSTVRAASPSGTTALSRDPLAERVDETGQPYLGAQQPKLVITEFSDYQCPHCARAHEQLRQLVAVYPEAIRIVHRHFPLDNDCNPSIQRPFHLHACYYARLAVCAASTGKFWQGNEYLFAHGRDEASVAVESFARAIEIPIDDLRNCLAARADRLLKLDIEAGLKLDIDGTPTFVIGGAKYAGELPADVLRSYPL
jgi:protein-disulfide isomerase